VQSRLKLRALVALAAAAISPGCGRGLGSYSGDVRLALAVPNGATIASLTYQIMNSSGATIAGPAPFSVSGPNATASLDIAVPATPPGDPGDVVSLSGTTNDGQSCITGPSPPFAVVAGGTASVMLTLVCGNGSPATPGQLVDIVANVAEADHCPVINSATVAPARAELQGAIALTAAASDADPGEALIYTWSPPDNVAYAHAASTFYRCTSVGTQTLTLTVADEHQPPCSTTATFTFDCVDSGYCGDGVIDAPGEQCDPPDGTSCLPDCTLLSEGNASCQLCEEAGTAASKCFDTSPMGEGSSKATFGCDGFSNATDQQNCFALLRCLRGTACQDVIHAATPDYYEIYSGYADPFPCLCNSSTTSISEFECASASSWTGVCAAQYAAAAGGNANVLPVFYSALSPAGVASNLLWCDIVAPCTSAQTCNVHQ
jgi:hypothetical protein